MTTRTLEVRSVVVHAVLLLAPLVLSGCGRGEEVTPQSIRDARLLWHRAGIQDYDLEWRTSGLRESQYRVEVREGRVRSVEARLPDGRILEQRPADPQPYGIDGLFNLLEDELAQLQEARPFGQPKGAKHVLRFDPHPEFGYPRLYQRDVVGSARGLTIEVLDFTPVEPVSPSRASGATTKLR